MQGLIGACFAAADEIKAGLLGLGKDTLRLRICFNASGISITNENGAVSQHGAMLGWSSTAQVFGFVNGSSCEVGFLKKETIQRASLVRVGCCSQTTIYATNLGIKRCHLALTHTLNHRPWAAA